jgi:flagellar biosynthesis/type III secretory pathway protein FliH
MKSSPKLSSRNAPVQFQAWNPADLDLEVAVPPAEPQKEQILAIFRSEVEANNDHPDRWPALYRGGTGQRFKSWQPGEMPSEPGGASKTEWTFFGPAKTLSQVIHQPRRFEFEVLEESYPQEQQEQPQELEPSVLDQARLQAEEIILAAQAEADNILLQAQEEIDQQKQEAYQQGRDQAALEFEQALKATRMIVEEVQAWKTELMAQGERILVQMLVEIAQKMFGEGVELNPEALQINLNRIMENAQGLGDLKIFLNPRDAKLLDSSWSEYQMLVTGDKVKIIPSGRITSGGCYIKGNMGNVDGRVETQLNAVLKTLEENSELAE